MNIQIYEKFKELIPPLTAEEFKQLEANCLSEGIRDAIVIWTTESGNFIADGHNRYEIAMRHQLPFNTHVLQLEDEFDVIDWIITNQLGRRNITDTQRKILIGQKQRNEKKRVGYNRFEKSSGDNLSPLQTAQKIADEYGITARQVYRYQDLAQGIEKLAPELKQDVLQEKVKVPSQELQTIAKAEPLFVANTVEDIKKEAARIKKQESEAKQARLEAQRKRLADEGAAKLLDIDFRLGDFEEVFSDIADGSVDCIITDPPYPREFLECWTKLARFAKRVLKPNGYCIAYSGQMYLPEVINRMSEHLSYYWTFAVYHGGQTQIVNGVNLICRWKPVLIFQNGKAKVNHTIQDYFISEKREKTGHDWQQSISGVSYLIDNFTQPNDFIIEPFAGSGTTIIAAQKLGRRVAAAEIDMQTYNIAKANIYDSK